MRILHFAPAFPELTQTFILNFVEKSASFADVAVATFRRPETPVTQPERYPVYVLPKKYCRRTAQGLVKYARQRTAGQWAWDTPLSEVIEYFEPDVVHCHFGHAGVNFHKYLQRTKANIPFVTSFYGVDASSRPFRCPEYYENLQALWKSSCHYLVEGPALGERLENLQAPPEKIKINPLLINTRKYPRKEYFRSATEPIRFLLVGRFVEKKGFHHFLEGVGRIQDQLPPFRVTMIGGGEMGEQYRQIINSYGMQARVNFLGWQSHPSVIQQLKEHDYFVHPSVTAEDGDSEGGAPTILLEAQAVGIPIITSDHADIPYVMAYDQFLASEGDVSSLEQVISSAVNFTGWEELADQGRKRVHAQHDFNATDRYFQALNEVCQTDRPLSYSLSNPANY